MLAITIISMYANDTQRLLHACTCAHVHTEVNRDTPHHTIVLQLIIGLNFANSEKQTVILKILAVVV
jgi:hypothetical protein